MKSALYITIALGGLSLLITALAAFVFYVDWIGQPTVQFIGQTPSTASVVAAAQDIAPLKAHCLSLAQAQDTNALQLAWLTRSFAGVAWFSLGWGLVSGLAFLYVHFLLRRLIQKGTTHGL